jgi:[FeFe] hydrogenase H-cluster maturation GTPase HydF
MSTVKHIGVFGKRNSGKSSLINKLTGQEVAIVSDIPGTTTDPVRKRMEIFGIGPVVIIDTAGIDDEGELGKRRVQSSRKIIEQIDIALLLFTNNSMDKYEKELINTFRKEALPVILVHNQSDIIPLDKEVGLDISEKYGIDVIEFSCNIMDDKEQQDAVALLTSFIVKGLEGVVSSSSTILEGLVERGDNIVLVCPVDSEAPEGRLILPQVNAIRDVLDRDGNAIVLQPANLKEYIEHASVKPKLVVTDSQAFAKVSAVVPNDIPLTGFSLLLARSKGPFIHYLKGTKAIDDLKDGDRLLILESCSHHSTCDDIGRVKLPALISKKSGKRLEWDVVSGLDSLPLDIGKYALVIQCGGCMITNRQLMARLKPALQAGIPVSNYGMALAYCTGIYERATAPLISQEKLI